MPEFPICPVCEQPVNIYTDAHIQEPLWPGQEIQIIRHHECPVKEEENE